MSRNMESLFFLLNDSNNHDYHHFHAPAPSTAGPHGSRGDHTDLTDILNPYHNFSPFADDGQFAHIDPYYSSYNYPPEVDYGGLVVDYWAPDPAANAKAYIPDQFRADIMSDRDDWSIVERRRQRRRQRLAAYRASARTVLKRIAGFGQMIDRGKGERILPIEQKARKVQWFDGSNDFDLLNDKKMHSLRKRKLRRRRRQELRQRRRRGMTSNSSDDGPSVEQSLETRAKVIGLAEPAYHRRWYRTPRYEAYNPNSLSARAIHQYASLVSPVLSSPRISGPGPEQGGYYRSAAARRRLIAIQENVENEMRKQKLEEKRTRKKKDQKRMKREDYEDWGKEILANKDGGADDGDVHTGIDCTVSKGSTKPDSTGLSTERGQASVDTNTIRPTTAGATSKDAEDPLRTLTANGNNGQDSKASSAATETTAGNIARYEISPTLPVDRANQSDNRLAVVPNSGHRPYIVPHAHSASSRRSHRSHGTNRTRRSAFHRALHRGLRHTRRFLRFINSRFGKLIWQNYYHWVYPYWDIWQERKQKERILRKEEEKKFEKDAPKEQEDPSAQQYRYFDKWSRLRSLFTRCFCIWPWAHQGRPNGDKSDDYPPSEKLDALEAQTDSVPIQNAVQEWGSIPSQEGNSAKRPSGTPPQPNISRIASNSRELRKVDPIPIPSDVESGSSNVNSQDDEPGAKNKKDAIKRKSGSRSSESRNNTWTKGCVLCGLERLGAAAVGEEVNI